MTRWLAIDHGHKRIGVASGDTETRLAVPLTVLDGRLPETAAEQIVKLVREHAAVGVVVGWPMNMDDSEGPQGVRARRFAADLQQRLSVDVRLWDERLSSFQADEALAGQWTRQKRRARQDAVAAAAFLQHFLDADGPATAPTPAGAAQEKQPPDGGSDG
ncbi:MAG: Holliday junction resolvase RuvX [Planctomycetes bacterium]|jgi:putative Holliday junction resolvase|nr:Holliday junction resolvase RuvX [Planctomycetota bacterium]